MYLTCANPNCNCEYDYGRGRLFRFHQPALPEQKPANSHGVKHYWLCGRCNEKFTIEFHKGLGVLLMERLEELAEARPSYCILQPEYLPEPIPAPQPLLPRLNRSRARNRKKINELAPSTSRAIELLENRKLERR
jgi:hypothetical protein